MPLPFCGVAGLEPGVEQARYLRRLLMIMTIVMMRRGGLLWRCS
jgi:hypothetical protein